MQQRLVDARELNFSRNQGQQRRFILRDLALQVERGEVLALLGASGSGKSTLLNLLGAIDRADSGHIDVAGKTLHPMDETSRSAFRRHSIGFIYQFFHLLPTLSVYENIALPLELNSVGRRDRRARITSMLEALSIAPLAHRYPEQLSGGEQQRCAIGRALIHDPDLVLADEPTGNLDAESGRRVMDLLTQTGRARERTLIIATHSRAVAERADRILVLEGGRLHEGTADALW